MFIFSIIGILCHHEAFDCFENILFDVLPGYVMVEKGAIPLAGNLSPEERVNHLDCLTGVFRIVYPSLHFFQRLTFPWLHGIAHQEYLSIQVHDFPEWL